MSEELLKLIDDIRRERARVSAARASLRRKQPQRPSQRRRAAKAARKRNR